MTLPDDPVIPWRHALRVRIEDAQAHHADALRRAGLDPDTFPRFLDWEDLCTRLADHLLMPLPPRASLAARDRLLSWRWRDEPALMERTLRTVFRECLDDWYSTALGRCPAFTED